MTEVKPALTAEEWAEKCFEENEEWTSFAARRREDGSIYVMCGYERDAETNRPHALAALALYNQPFGFTREDVEFLRELARTTRKTLIGSGAASSGALLSAMALIDREADFIDSLASRISALLPPEAP